jgi:hypothetical protein
VFKDFVIVFSGAFAKLRIATASSVMFVSPSIHMEHLLRYLARVFLV